MDGNFVRNIFIFIGQFGNKVGLKLITSLNLASGYKDSDSEDRDIFISVDTELKVVKSFGSSAIGQNAEKGIFDKIGRGGNWSMGYKLQREDHYGIPMKEIVVKIVMRNFESRTPYSCGITVVHSLVGGTGGGLGCAVLESLREEFPKNHISSITTAPFVSGESPLQHYNALLTLHWLQRYADCVLIFHNDEVMNILAKQKAGQKDAKVTLDDINDYICYNVASLYEQISCCPPAEQFESDLKKGDGKNDPLCSGRSRFSDQANQNKQFLSTLRGERKEKKTREVLVKNLDRLSISGGDKMSCTEQKETKHGSKYIQADNPTRTVVNSGKCIDRNQNRIKARVAKKGKGCNSLLDDKEVGNNSCQSKSIFQILIPNEKMKFISTSQRHSKKFTSDFKPFLSSLIRDFPRQNQTGQRYKNSGLVLIARGEYSKAYMFEREEVLNYMMQSAPFGNNLRVPVEVFASTQCIPDYQFPLSLSLFVNTNRIADFIEHVQHKASLLYQNAAYLHWYTKFGITDEYFLGAFEAVANIVQEYRDL